MITKIGLCSGEILSLLDERRESVTVKEIYDLVDAPKSIVLMSLGWLVRERFVRAVIRDAGIQIEKNEEMTQDASPLTLASIKTRNPMRSENRITRPCSV